MVRSAVGFRLLVAPEGAVPGGRCVFTWSSARRRIRTARSTMPVGL